VRSIPISKFKATCLAVLAEVHKTGQFVTVTRFGKPVAEIGPPAAARRPSGWLGAMRGTGRIKGDIISPVVSAREWEALRR
jgi:antitoxin (DNA-binding transcriptional repressor) of toxin-antitoxin stability system